MKNDGSIGKSGWNGKSWMEYQGKLNETYTAVSILFQVLKVLLIKRYSYQFFCFYQLLHLQISFFTFLALHSTLSEKRFSAQIFTFLTDSLQPSNLLNSENSQSMTKDFFLSAIWLPTANFWSLWRRQCN